MRITTTRPSGSLLGRVRPNRLLLAFALVLNLASFFAATPINKVATAASPKSLHSRQQAIQGLHVSGNQILNGDNQPVRLLGVNRSGSEYACIDDFGFFSGPSDAPSVAAIASWDTNVVRVPLNEDCWLGINGVDSTYGGANYQQAIEDYVNLLNSYGQAVILDLHWSAPGDTPATDQEPMADEDHSPAFWTSVANAFKGNLSVLFDLYNEPYPDNNTDSDTAWTCVRDGGTCSGVDFTTAGMQELVNTVRATGATNIVMVGGPNYANSLTQWLTYEPTDPTGNIAASWHSYDTETCNNVTCWNNYVLPVLNQVPVITGEIGEDNCTHTYVDSLMNWLDSKNASYLAWTWLVTGDCAGPTLITDYDGTPTQVFGQGFHDHLVSLATTTTNPSPSTTNLTASSDNISTNQNVNFTATVTGSGTTPTGTVIFTNSTTNQMLGTAALVNGTASLATSFNAAGTYQISATYGGDANYTGSNAVITEHVLASTTPPSLSNSYIYNLPLLAKQANTQIGNTNTYITFQNLSITSTATITVQYYGVSDGVAGPSDSFSLTAKGQQAIAPNIPTNTSYGGIVTSSQPLNLVVSEVLNGGGSAYNVQAATASTLYSPLALNGQYGFTTSMIVFNAGNTATTATVQFYDENGNAANGATQNLTIPAHASRTLNQNAANSGLSSSHTYWAKITASDNSATLSAQVIEFGPSNFVVTFNALVTSQVKNTLYAPATFNGQFNFVTGMAIANPNNAAASGTITYYDETGKQLLAQTINIPANGVIGVFQPGVSGLGRTVSSATISGNQPLIMTVNELGPNNYSGTYVGIASGSSSVALPVMANGFAGFVTGATILNTGNTTANLTLTYLDANGTSIGTPQQKSLAPNASFLVYQGGADQSLPNNFFGTALITSDQPLLVTTNALNTINSFFYTYTEPS